MPNRYMLGILGLSFLLKSTAPIYNVLSLQSPDVIERLKFENFLLYSMKKHKIIAKSSISKSEFLILESIRSSNLMVFSPKDIERLMGMERTRCYQLVSRMKQKGLISEIENGKYVTITPSPGPDILSVAPYIVFPAYLSFWTALSFHGFTEQLPLTIFVVTTKRKQKIEHNGMQIRFITLSPSRFFGYLRVDGMIMADKEKSLIDSLLLPRYAGGMIELAKCLSNAWKEIDVKMLIDYALRMKNKSLIKRLGYLTKVLDLPIEPSLIRVLKDNIGRGYSLLDPSGPKGGGYDREWMLRENISIEQEAIY